MLISSNYAKTTLCTLFFLVSSPVLGDSVYKWTDENGVIHYGDAKPGDKVKSNEVKISGHGASDQEAATKRRESSLKQFQPSDDKASKDPLSDPAKMKEDKKKNCEQAIGNLKMLNSGERLRMQDDGGEESVLSDEQRQSEIKRNQTYIDVYCSDMQ